MMYSTNILLNLISTIFKTINSSVDDTRKTLALFNKDWNTYKTNWQNANGFWGKVGSVFAPSKSTSVTPQQLQILKNWNNAVKHGCTNQETFNRIIADADDKTKLYFAGLNKGKGSVEGLKNAQNVAKASTIGLTIAQTALNAAISMGISLLINLAVTGITKLVNANKEAIESANELREKYTDFKETNASNISTLKGLKDEFTELSKGVSQYGDNISLTTEQYDRYREIIQQIVGISPSLSEGCSTENGHIADKNGLLERAIELQEIEYRNELRKITNLDNLKTSMSGYIAEYKEALNGGILTTEGNIVGTTIDTDFKNSLWQLFNTNNREGFNAEDMAKQIMESLGVADVEKELKKYYNEYGYWQDGWFWNDYANTIAGNLDAVTGSLTYEDVGLDEDIFDQNLEKLESYSESYGDMLDSVKLANEAIQTDLGYIAEYTDGYSDLSTEQQKFVADFLKGFDINDIASENAMGTLSYDNDKMASVKSQIKKFVEELSKDTVTKDALSKLYAIPTDSQSVGDFVSQFRSALDTVIDYCEENGIEIPLGISESETEINELEAQYNRVVEYVKGKFDGYDFSDFFKTKSINSKEELDKFLEIAQGANTATEAMEKYVQSSTSLDKMTVSVSEMSKAADGLSNIGTAMKELGEDGKISLDTITKIKEAVGGSIGDWERYEEILLNAKAGSEEYNSILSDLTYATLKQQFASTGLANATEEQIARTLEEAGVTNSTAVAHDMLMRAKAAEMAASIDQTNASAENIAKLIDEANMSEQDKIAMYDLIAAEIHFNNNTLDVSQKITALRNLAIEAGIAKEAILSVSNVDAMMAKSKNGKYTSAANKALRDAGVTYTVKNGDATYSYKGQSYDGRGDVVEAVQYDLVNSAIDDLAGGAAYTATAPIYGSGGGGGGGGGSDKNEALDNYLKYTENIYKIHQNEEKYINDLQWGLDNLTKIDEERLEIAEKIKEAYRDLADNRIKDIEHQNELLLNQGKTEYDLIENYKNLQNIISKEASRYRVEMRKDLLAMGYTDEEEIARLIENSDYIQELQKNWWDNRSKEVDARFENSKGWIDERNKKGDWSLYADSEYEAWQRVLKWLKDEYPNELEKIKEAEQNAIDASFQHSADWIDERNTYNDWDLYGDNEVAAWERVLKRFKSEFPNELEKIKEIEQEIFEARKKAFEKSISDIEEYISARNTYKDWDAYGDSEVKAIQRITKVIEYEYSQRLISYDEYIDKLQEQTQRIYSLAQNEIDESLGSIDRYISARNHYNDWDEVGDSEIKAIRRQIRYLRNAYDLNLMSYEEYTEKYAEYTQKLYSVAKDSIIEEVSKLMEDYEEMKNLESSQLESNKTLLQSYYDVTNAVVDAQQEINKELKASMTMYEYLNEDTRELLFNQEDFNILNEELLEIQSAADELRTQYQEDILNANAETIAEITSQYQMQYETMMKQYEIAKAELEVAKKRQKLDNVLAERNTRMFINGQWQWVAKTQDIIDAQNELAEAEAQRKKQEAALEQTEAINDFTAQINSLETDLNEVKKYWADMQELLNGESDEVAEALKQISEVSSPELQRVIEATGGNVDSFSAVLSESTTTLSTVINGDRGLTALSGNVSDLITDLQGYSDAIQLLTAQINGAKVNTITTGDSGGSSSQDIIAQMKANSAAWKTATTQEEKDRLHEANVSLGKQIGLSEDDYNSGTGVWNYPTTGSSISGGGSSSSSKASSSSGSSSSSSNSSSSSKQVNTSDQYVNTAGGVQSNPNWDGKKKGSVGSFYKYADGTRYTAGGFTLMGEDGDEFYIPANGRLIPINQPTIGNIGAGGIVFNREQMANLRNLWDLSNLSRISPFISSSNANNQSTVIDNSIHINGLTVGERGNEDWINGLRRYVATHK